MSRVDEAMRRAAQEAPAIEPDELPREDADVQDMEPEDLAREPFPVEMAERRGRERTRRPAPAPRVTAAAAVPTESTDKATLLQRINSTLAEKVVIDTNTPVASREQYRRLAAALHHAQAENGLQVVMIASAVQGEGKTLTATNLALTFSESYQRSVLLIDADLRRPTLHSVFGIDNTLGLSEGLMSPQLQRLPVVQASQRLAILPAGRPSGDPMAGLTSERMRQVIHEARETFDWVIIDTPPVVLLPDANLLGSMADGAVLVIKAGSTPYDLVNRAVAAVGRDRILGTVLNRAVDGPHVDGYGYYSSYYAAQEESNDRS